MYAVIENGGKQYRVELGAELEVDSMTADPGAKIDIGRVLLVADGEDTMIGRPVVEGARVTAEVLRPTRGDKIVVFKYRPKARRRVKHGHRADLTLVRIADIEFAGRSAAKEADAEAKKQESARAEAVEAAAAKAKADEALAKKLAKTETKETPSKTTAKPAAKPKATAPKPTTAAKSTAKPKTTAKTEAKATAAKPAPKPNASQTTKKSTPAPSDAGSSKRK